MTWTCPKCERELLKQDQWHNCVKVSIDSLFEGRPAELILIFDKILAEVADWDQVLVSTTQNCIVFVHHQTFLVIRPMQKMLDVKFYSDALVQGKLIHKSMSYAGRFQNNVRLTQLNELTPQLFSHIHQSYKML